MFITLFWCHACYHDGVLYLFAFIFAFFVCKVLNCIFIITIIIIIISLCLACTFVITGLLCYWIKCLGVWKQA